MKVYYYTFGCKVNQYETENIRQIMEQKCFDTTKDYSDADIAIINTCTVTSRSDLKCRQLLHKIKRNNTNCIIVLTGCFTQAFAEKAETISECDIITGTSNKSKIPDFIDSYLCYRKRIVSIPSHTKGEKFEQMTNNQNYDKTRTYIKIQDGCDQYCTYCIIPYARGHIRSKSLSDIKNEVENFKYAGYKEIVVVGINLCCYGKDFNDGTRLTDAIELICNTAENSRVRLGSIEPELICDDDIERLSRLKNLCPQFHLSLQSGCDKTLKAMNRKYTCREYTQLCEKLRKKFPGCAITTDIMVGFPGETDDDFNKSLDFVKNIGFAKAHIFPFSKRKGTIAEKLNAQIPKAIKEQRVNLMADICDMQQKLFLETMTGKTCSVLFEKENSPHYHQGYTANYTLVKVPRTCKDISLRKQLHYVKIINAEKDYCIGELVKEKAYE